MKNKFLVLAMGLIAAVSLVACGPKPSVDEADIENLFDEVVEDVEVDEEPVVEEPVVEEPVVEEPVAEGNTLEDYYSTPEAQQGLEQGIQAILAQYTDTYSDIKMYAVGNTMMYEFTFIQNIEEDQVDSFNSYMLESLSATAESSCNALKTEAGVDADTEVTITYIYYNADGSVVGQYDFTY